MPCRQPPGQPTTVRRHPGECRQPTQSLAFLTVSWAPHLVTMGCFLGFFATVSCSYHLCPPPSFSQLFCKCEWSPLPSYNCLQTQNELQFLPAQHRSFGPPHLKMLWHGVKDTRLVFQQSSSTDSQGDFRHITLSIEPFNISVSSAIKWQ